MLNFQVSIPRVVALLPPNPFSKDHRAAFVGPVRRLPLGKCDAPVFTKAVGRTSPHSGFVGCECVSMHRHFSNSLGIFVKPLKLRENSDLLHLHVTSIIK